MGSANAIKSLAQSEKKDPGGMNPLPQGLGGYTRRVRSRTPTEALKYKTPFRQELPQVEPRQNLKKSAHALPEARGLLSGTMKWGTPNVYRKNHLSPIKDKAKR